MLKGATEEARRSAGNVSRADTIYGELRAETPIHRPPPLRQCLQQRAPYPLVCPITLQLLQDPVLLLVDGCTYSRTAIERHFNTRREGASYGKKISIQIAWALLRLKHLRYNATQVANH